MAQKATYDSTIVRTVRNQVLGDIQEVLKESAASKKFGKRKWEMLLRLSGSVLPRVNEHTGAEGKELPVPIFNVSANTSNTAGNRIAE